MHTGIVWRAAGGALVTGHCLQDVASHVMEDVEKCLLCKLLEMRGFQLRRRTRVARRYIAILQVATVGLFGRNVILLVGRSFVGIKIYLLVETIFLLVGNRN